jgi:tRNA pseudouridine-54 N-methylase
MRRFLILFDDIPIDRASVKSGSNSFEVVTACRCVNVGLFVSRNLRRDVIVSIAKGPVDDMKIASFPGNALKRVSPDERSISFFLFKALDVAGNLSQNSQQVLDNGIVGARESLAGFIARHQPNQILIVDAEQKLAFDSLEILDNAIIIYETGSSVNLASLGSTFLNNFRVDSIRKHHLLHPERFILDINEFMDNKEENP